MLGTLKFSIATFQTIRSFSTTLRCCTYYDILNVPKGASKAAIKANYYKLSKRYHPDINKTPSAKAKFQAVSEAWSILGDDRQRRTYDHELSVSQTSSAWPNDPYGYGSSGQHYYDPSSMYEARRRGATHAWQNARRGRTHARRDWAPPPPHFTQRNRQNPFGRTHRSGTVSDDSETFVRDPWESGSVRRATGRGNPYTTPEDDMKRESMATRFAQVIGVVFFIVVLTGGFGRY